MDRIFPVLVLACNLGSAICYAVSGDFRRALYWVASAICIAAVTF